MSSNLYLSYLTGVLGMTAEVYPALDGSIINTGGSAFTESLTKPGFYTAVVTQSLTGTEQCNVLIGGAEYGVFDLQPVSGGFKLVDLVGSNAGSGINTLTVTVEDGSSNPIPNAAVDLISGGLLIGQAITDIDGMARLFCNNGIFTINALAQGYNGSSMSLSVNSSTSIPITLSQFTPTVSATSLVTGYLTCVDQNGNPLAGIVHTLVVISLPPDAFGLSVNTATRTVTSGSGQNNVQFADLVPHGMYTIQRGTGPAKQFECPDCSNVPPSFPIPISGALV